MKVFILAILLSTTAILYGQDSLLVQSWINLKGELRNRLDVVQKFGIVAPNLGDTVSHWYLNNLCSSLRKELDQTAMPDSLQIDCIRTYVLVSLGVINQMRLFLDDNTPVQAKNEFELLERSLARAGERVSMVSKSYNQQCLMTGRTDLIY